MLALSLIRFLSLSVTIKVIFLSLTRPVAGRPRLLFSSCITFTSFLAFRITPAYAGKRNWHLLNWHLLKDHPRIRGKKLVLLVLMLWGIGSPPHTREKASCVLWLCFSSRITPAYAGKSSKTLKNAKRQQDHPRIRGKKLHRRNLQSRQEGSPPHTREKDLRTLFQSQIARITPAYAGKSPLSTTPHFIRKDHPRIRGKKDNNLTLCRELAGSPPHTREKGFELAPSTPIDGITPAYAGKRRRVCREVS